MADGKQGEEMPGTRDGGGDSHQKAAQKLMVLDVLAPNLKRSITL